MKRKLFFWLDKLQISRGERIAVSLLMGLILLLSTAVVFIDTTPSVNDERYVELEKVFRDRSENKQQEHAAIMARYKPEPSNLITDRDLESNEPEANVKTLETPEPEEVFQDSIRININKAGSDELQKLPGIGPAYSRRIVEWRNEYGDFTSVDQLLEIRGIGPVRLGKIRSMIVL